MSSFKNLAKELVKFDTFDSILNGGRHKEFKEMIVHFVFGKFECKKRSSKDQRKRSWNSTKCSTKILYRYNSRKKRGEIEIDKEYEQACKNCNTYTEPEFDLEATDKAMEKMDKRIKKVFYNEAPPANEVSERHSQASERRNPHDSARCEACREGICPEQGYVADRLPPSIRSNYDHLFFGHREKIDWALMVNGVPVCKVRVPVREVRVPVSEVRVPAREVRVPASEVRVPARHEAHCLCALCYPSRSLRLEYLQNREVRVPAREVQVPQGNFLGGNCSLQ